MQTSKYPSLYPHQNPSLTQSSDGIYPDTESGGYKGAEACGTFTPASVISTSYGSNEADLTAAYEERQCHEYMKLGLAGVTILYSSGDSGVAGNGGECCTKAKCAGGTYNSGTKGTFNPSFPGKSRLNFIGHAVKNQSSEG